MSTHSFHGEDEPGAVEANGNQRDEGVKVGHEDEDQDDRDDTEEYGLSFVWGALGDVEGAWQDGKLFTAFSSLHFKEKNLGLENRV